MPDTITYRQAMSELRRGGCWLQEQRDTIFLACSDRWLDLRPGVAEKLLKQHRWLVHSHYAVHEIHQMSQAGVRISSLDLW